ncbi:unnamed protein product [Pocillopora meandrina]|uniref:BZIP domain-containing protein n=1 Tax=Pocillopora meandrina TaxID=46732 RepID=A0AAU9W394_9CNID|nr:unnamed protein product [Pocillopora meandrina]
MDYSEFFPEMSPMDEILERDFSNDVCGPDWSHNHRLGDLVGEDNFENVLLQTRLDLDNFETESIASSEPQSPLDLQVGKNQLFTDDELISISIRLLNQQLKNLPKAEAKQIRKRRRSLKNRGYATVCRQRRTALKESLEQQNKRLKLELKEAKENLYNTLRDRDMFKKKYEQLHALLSSRKRHFHSLNLIARGFRGTRTRFVESLHAIIALQPNLIPTDSRSTMEEDSMDLPDWFLASEETNLPFSCSWIVGNVSSAKKSSEMADRDDSRDIQDLFDGETSQEVHQDDDNATSESSDDESIPKDVKILNDEEIANMRVQELNRFLRNVPWDEAKKIRKRRRNLKNRGYALTCRLRKQQEQEDLINENTSLRKQVEDGRWSLLRALKEKETYKKKYMELQQSFTLFKQSMVTPRKDA